MEFLKDSDYPNNFLMKKTHWSWKREKKTWNLNRFILKRRLTLSATRYDCAGTNEKS